MNFTFNDRVKTVLSAPAAYRPGSLGWIVAIFPADRAPTYRPFLPGPIYSVEFEDGAAIDIEEIFLEPEKVAPTNAN